MSYIYLQEQGEESSAACFSDIPASALSRSIRIAGGSCSSGSGMESSLSFLSGTTLGLLMEHHGAGLSERSAEASLVRTSARPVKAQASKEREAGFGLRCSGQFARFDPKSFSWRTLQCSLFEEFEEFSGTWPRWGMMRNGGCWELPIPHGVAMTRSRITSAIESGFLRHPTPRANDAEKRGNIDTMNPRNGLAGFVKRYPTPCASDGNKWNHMTAEERRAKGQHLRLVNVITSETGERAGGAQNPEFTEWLMGWPLGWTDLEPLETARFRQWLRLHGISSSPETQPA